MTTPYVNSTFAERAKAVHGATNKAVQTDANKAVEGGDEETKETTEEVLTEVAPIDTPKPAAKRKAS